MIRRARRDGREARGHEEREKREDEKGSHCFFKSSGYDSHCFFKYSGYDILELKHKKKNFFQAYRMHYSKKICHGVKQNAKICAIGEQNVIN